MLLSTILHEEAIKIDLEAEEKYEAIEELVDLLVDTGSLSKKLREHVTRVVFEREESMSTGMEHRIALPHGSTKKIDSAICAVGISQKGLPFDSMDQKSAKLIVLLVLPKDPLRVHVRTLACVAHLFSNTSLRNKLIETKTAEKMLKLIRKEEAKPVFDQYRNN